MVSTGYHDTGEEWSQKNSWRQDQITRDTTVEILLYDDSTDQLSDSSDIGDITTEPNDGNYSRQTVNLDSSDVSLSVVSGDLRAEATVTFDVNGSTGSVDASGAVVDLQSDVVNSETAQNPHLLSTSTLDAGSQDLQNFDVFEITIRLDLN